MRNLIAAVVVLVAVVSMMPCQGSEEINECLTNNGGCEAGTTCHDRPRGFVCHVEKSCGFYKTLSVDEEVEFTTPNYPSDYNNLDDCSWTFAVPANHYVEVVTSYGTIQFQDIFTINVSENLDGSDPFEVEQLWGSFYRRRLAIRDARFIFIKFVSDWYSTMQGLKCSLKLVPIKTPNCGFKGVLSNKWTNVTTPNYPSHYPNFTYCKWNFEIPLYHDVQFLIESGSTERDHDIFTVRRSSRSDGLQEVNVGDFHGDSISTNMLIYNVRFISVIFTSDNQTTHQGLKSSFRLVKGCGFSKTLQEGEIVTVSTPNYPQKYRDNDYCSWTLAVPENFDVGFRMEEGDSFDNFVVKKSENSDGSEAVEVLNIYSQAGERKIKISNAKLIFVTFTTDRKRTRKGITSSFSLLPKTNQTVCGFNATLTPSWTYAATPNYPAEYTNDANCKWTFKVRPGYDVLLVIKRGKLELGYDHFKVTKSSKLDGSDEVDVFEVTDDRVRTKMGIVGAKFVFVTFTSDFSETRKGIEASLRLARGLDLCLINNGGCDAGTTCYNQPRGHVCHVEKSCGFYATLSTDEVTNITTPNYPDFYNNNDDCSWTFVVPEHHSVELVIGSGITESYDKFKVSKMGNLEGSSREEIFQLWGVFARRRIVIDDAKFIFMTFNSDRSVTKKGFWSSLKLVPNVA